jgi:hypothetical protein
MRIGSDWKKKRRLVLSFLYLGVRSAVYGAPA